MRPVWAPHRMQPLLQHRSPPSGFSGVRVQMLGVFMDTLVICSATAMIILSSGVLDNPAGDINGIE